MSPLSDWIGYSSPPKPNINGQYNCNGLIIIIISIYPNLIYHVNLFYLICTCVLNSIYDSNICVRDSSKSLSVNSIILLHGPPSRIVSHAS